MVKITSGMYTGIIGHLSYDEEGFEWIVIEFGGMHRDISTTSTQYTFI